MTSQSVLKMINNAIEGSCDARIGTIQQFTIEHDKNIFMQVTVALGRFLPR